MINQVKLQNFRIHSSFQTNFLSDVNIIVGDNGVGKTSVIEAIYIGLSGKSWRSNFETIIKKNKSWWRIDLKIGDNTRIVKYNGEKTFELGGKKHLLLPKSQRNPIVLFEPDDLNLLYGSPSRRRRWLDKLLTDIDNQYSSTLNKFDKVLKQRNALLKNQATPDQLFVWDLQFADLSAQIINKRLEIINTINQKLPAEYKKISGRKETLELKYNFDDLVSKQAILNQLQTNHQLEIMLGNTSIGPQKHDILFQFKNQPAATTASRGENRSIVSALKNIEYHLKKSPKSTPLILLDDIMSELDEQHQINLLNNFKNSQVIITSVNLPKNLKNINIIKLN